MIEIKNINNDDKDDINFYDINENKKYYDDIKNYNNDELNKEITKMNLLIYNYNYYINILQTDTFIINNKLN